MNRRKGGITASVTLLSVAIKELLIHHGLIDQCTCEAMICTPGELQESLTFELSSPSGLRRSNARKI